MYTFGTKAVLYMKGYSLSNSLSTYLDNFSDSVTRSEVLIWLVNPQFGLVVVFTMINGASCVYCTLDYQMPAEIFDFFN